MNGVSVPRKLALIAGMDSKGEDSGRRLSKAKAGPKRSTGSLFPSAPSLCWHAIGTYPLTNKNLHRCQVRANKQKQNSESRKEGLMKLENQRRQ